MLPFHDEARRCREAQKLWQSQPVRQRVKFAQAVRHLLVERSRALSRSVADDVQRDADEVIGTDILPSAAGAKFLVRNADKTLSAQRVRSRPLWLLDCQETVHRRPHGIVGIIGTWNYPIYLTLGAILPALVAGNGVLWKPSEHTPLTAKLLHQLLLDAGVPQDLLVQLPGERDVGQQLCEAEIDFLHFTGSDGVGRKIAARLGERLIPSALELSGCDAFVVLDDANLDLAVKTAYYGTTLNGGQTCISARRAFVAKPLFEDFLQQLLPMAAEAYAQPLVTRGQVEQRQRIIAEAKARNLRVEEQGGMTVIVDPPADFRACMEASFVPILSVLPFDSDDELLAKIHASPFGLSGAIFSTDTDRAKALAANLRTGSVIINDVIVPTANPATPFGGRGASGWGVTGGAEGLRHMTVPQVVSRRRGSFRPHVEAAVTRDPAATDTIQGLLKMTHARRFRDRWRGFRQLWRGARNRKTTS